MNTTSDSEFTVETTAGAEFPPVSNFDSMSLPEDLLRGIYSMGFERPSAIQSVTIMPMVKGRDVLGQAQSGTGKTGTFSIGMLSKVDAALRKPQALVLAHTHELADQIFQVVSALSQFMGLKVILAIGGESNPRHVNVRELRAGAHVVIGTPGRVYDLATSGDLSFANLRYFVLDEADEMLTDRFGDQVSEIVKLGLPDECRIAFFSATMPPEVVDLAERILTNPVRVTLKTADVKLDAIQQYIVPLDEDSWKLECMCDIFESISIPQSIIFTNTKERAERLYHALTERGFPVSVIYGEPMSGTIRKQRMREFRDGRTRVLIATNLLARGIDVQQVELVINFDMPSFEDKENYIHRIGRCARFGRKGKTIALVTPPEKDIMDQIAAHYEFTVQPLPQDLKALNGK